MTGRTWPFRPIAVVLTSVVVLCPFLRVVELVGLPRQLAVVAFLDALRSGLRLGELLLGR